MTELGKRSPQDCEDDSDNEMDPLDPNMSDSDPDGSKPKQKRRSKNDVQGRDHKCTFCDKTYLSYPALYTHMKNKHAKGPDGQPLINFNSGRGRGRPKKNSNLFPMANHFQRPQGNSTIDPTTDEFFKAEDKMGGPSQILEGFQEVYTEIFIRKAPNVPKEEGS